MVTDERLNLHVSHLGVVPLERRFGQENQEVEPQEDRKRRPFYGVIESPNT